MKQKGNWANTEQLHRKNYDMKRKYYLRGLGIGILVTALVFTFTGPKKMTDDEIIKRAEQLGYVKGEEPDPTINLKDLLETGTPTPSPASTPTSKLEPTGIPEKTTTPTETPVITKTPVPTDEPTLTPTLTVEPSATAVPTPTKTVKPTVEPTATTVPTPTKAPTVIPTESITPQPTETPEPTNVPESEVVTASIVVERGNTATMVCRKIEAAGIVEDGNELREYIVNNQLSDFINVGTYTLSSDMTFEEIAAILTVR